MREKYSRNREQPTGGMNDRSSPITKTPSASHLAAQIPYSPRDVTVMVVAIVRTVVAVGFWYSA